MSGPDRLSMRVFTPLTTSARGELAAERIAAAIALGLFADGDPLPPEEELSRHLGIATVTLREALTLLRGQGLVETRRGRRGGTFVRSDCKTATRLMVDRLSRLDPQAIADLGDEHFAVAGTAAYLAAQRAGQENLDRLQASIDRLGRAETHWHQCRADSEFHVEIAVASGSDRLVQHEVRLQAETVEYLWLIDEREPDLGSAIRSHREILRAIRSGDPELARKVAQKHIRKNVAFISAMAATHGG